MSQTTAPTEPAPADAALPAVESHAVCQLYRDFQDAERFGSSNDVAQILDDWFVEQGFPTVLYRA